MLIKNVASGSQPNWRILGLVGASGAPGVDLELDCIGEEARRSDVLLDFLVQAQGEVPLFIRGRPLWDPLGALRDPLGSPGRRYARRLEVLQIVCSSHTRRLEVLGIVCRKHTRRFCSAANSVQEVHQEA